MLKAALSAAAVALTSSVALAQESRLWIVTGSDVAALTTQSFAARAFAADGRPAFAPVDSANELVAAELAESALGDFMQVVHANFRRCGGFTVHASREAAMSEIGNAAYVAGYRAPAPRFSLDIDQQGHVVPALDMVSKTEIVSTIAALQDLGTRYYQTQKGQDAALLVKALWERHGANRPDFSVALVRHGWLQNSVIATIKGAELPDEIVVVGAHLDSINQQDNNSAPGADDDASGVAAVTETLRVLMKAGFKPKRTIQFMAYAAEEVGLRGSGEIAEQYRAAGKNVVAALQLDMTGFAGSEKNIYLVTDFVSGELTDYLRKLMLEYNRTGAHQITYGDTRCGYACSDHSSWTRIGVPSAFPFESAFADYNRAIHTPRDTLANFDNTGTHQARFTKLAIEFAIEVAKSSGPARAPTPPTSTSKYLYSTLRVISHQNPRGCAVDDANCMVDLCRRDLGPSAWKGWGGCWREGAAFQCNFECLQQREAE